MKKVLYFLPFLSASIFAEEGTSPVRHQNMWQTVIMIGIALVFFYLILWRPEQKRRKRMEKQRKSLSKGDRVTAMGIIGTVVRVEANSVILKMVDGAKVEMLKNAITDVQSGNEQNTANADQLQT